MGYHEYYTRVRDDYDVVGARAKAEGSTEASEAAVRLLPEDRDDLKAATLAGTFTTPVKTSEGGATLTVSRDGVRLAHRFGGTRTEKLAAGLLRTDASDPLTLWLTADGTAEDANAKQLKVTFETQQSRDLAALTAECLVSLDKDAAFDAAAKERAVAFEELATRENLGEILQYHVVAGAVKSSDLKSGSVATLNGRSMKVEVGGDVKVDGVKVTEADKVACGGNVVVPVVDEVVFPAFSINAKVQTPQEILAFEGWAPEVINGRLAMIGFVLALGGEITTGESFTSQAANNFGELAHTIFVWSLASLFPAFSSNEGYEANPFKMAESKEWDFVFRGCPPWLAVKDVFSPEVEQLNGRAAMVGCASLIVIETLSGNALF